VSQHALFVAIRRQVVVKREAVLDLGWRDLPFQENLWPITLDLFLDSGEPDIVLVAAKRHPKFKRYLEDLRMLRAEGFALSE
jgi:hypothetical protein